jgi:D-alanyl-D-alanine-carboxypeptidase/D-alanyl-D-alanine-endopeptidase
MKTALSLGTYLLSAVLLASNAAAASQLATNAQKAAADLPRGCIVVAEQTSGGTPGFSVAGRQEPAGIPPERVIFEIGSISKIFTGILLAQAVIEKRVALDTTLRGLMGKERSFADANVAAITLKQLATHTSGLPRIPGNLLEGGAIADPYAHYDRARLDQYLGRAKLAHAAPFPSSYSNLGVGLLGDLLARLYGKTWEELVRERITKPLGMVDTCVALSAEQMRRLAPPYSGDRSEKPWHFLSLAGAGALHSTAADMVKFGEALRKPGSTSLQAAIEMIEQPQEGDSIGLCLQIQKLDGQTAFWFSGGTGGYRSWISANPSAEYVLVMLINNAALSPESVLTGVASHDTQKISTAPSDPALAAYVGDYDTGVKAGGTNIHYVFEARGSDLWMQITGQPFIPLSRHPATKDRFEYQPVKAEIQFARKNGEIVGATLFQQGMEIRATKLADRAKAR